MKFDWVDHGVTALTVLVVVAMGVTEVVPWRPAVISGFVFLSLYLGAIAFPANRAARREEELLEREVYPIFPQYFHVPVDLYKTNRGEFRRLTLEIMQVYGYEMGTRARAQEECRMALRLGTGYRMTQQDCNRFAREAKVAWGQALEVLAKIDSAHAAAIPHWTRMEPYASYKESLEAE